MIVSVMMLLGCGSDPAAPTAVDCSIPVTTQCPAQFDRGGVINQCAVTVYGITRFHR